MAASTGRAFEIFERMYGGPIPHVAELGIAVVELGDGTATMRLPYSERLVGNPENGVLHGGAVTTLIDSVCGLAVLSGLPEPRHIATVDLRIDYLKPAAPGRDLLARAECYRSTRQIAFVRATAFHVEDDGGEAQVAAAMGTFMFTGVKAAAGGAEARP